ncbi:hypothetical protein O0L34_g11381 [Tuta absoluta]|nr:hypothetical protein O0L34_g11381 [Tuta absoluta]
MSDQDPAGNLRPLAPAGFYLLDLSAPPGLHDSVPLQLILSDIEPRYIAPLLPSQPEVNVSHSSNTESSFREENPREAKSDTRVNIISNEILVPNKHYRLQSTETKKKNVSKDIRKHETKHDVSHIINKIFVDEDNVDLKQPIFSKCLNVNRRIECYLHIKDKPVLPRALAVLPKALKMVNGSIYPVKSLPPRVRFGPVQGVFQKVYQVEADQIVKEAARKETPIFLLRQDEFSVTHIDVTDKEHSNWLSLLPLGNMSTANVWLYEEDDEVYGITTRTISSKTPLALGYSKKYADEHNLTDQPVLNLDYALISQPWWWCEECKKDFGSSTLLTRHIRENHMEKPTIQRKRCPFCARTFRRLFTLRRHKINCTKKPEPENSPSTPKTNYETTETSRNLELCIAPSTEETRTPSDESFQNYTNALDFSTNLFDPDRISNLDISASSKSEPEFVQYSQWLKFDHLDSNEDYSKFCKGLKFDKNKTTFEEPATVTCVYCNQTMTKIKKRRHIRECPARRLDCECGKKFTRKEDFAKHVYFNHNSILGEQSKEETDVRTDTKTLIYKCDDCKLIFKRRGMLINHLWRVHKTKSAEVPLERRVRHYPCSVCPKIYKTAAKRNRHVEVHHPGAPVRAAPIEGARLVSQPARCTACPREYVTKAKLLQHIRAQHPQLATAKAFFGQQKLPQLKSEPPASKRKRELKSYPPATKNKPEVESEPPAKNSAVFSILCADSTCK